MLKGFLSRLGALSAVKRKKARTQLIVALFLLCLGFGNLLFGRQRYHEYRILSRQATAGTRITALGRQVPMLAPTVDIAQEARHATKLRSHLAFYNVVSLGGTCIMVLGGVFILLALLTVYHTETPPTEGG
jgi:hypothetical protein